MHRVIRTEKQFFMLVQKPHRKTDDNWSPSNPRVIIERHDPSDVEVKIFVAIVNEKIPIAHVFINKEGRPVSVNGPNYR